nr:DUF4972 domain-containing protein [Bacteroides sp.]
MMNAKYLNRNLWYCIGCMILVLQLMACTEETHDNYTVAPEIKDVYIDRLDALIIEMTDLQTNSEYGEKKGQYPAESRAILTDAIDAANRAVLLIKYQNPSPSESEKQRYVDNVRGAIDKFEAMVRTEDAETIPSELFVDGRGNGGSYIDFGRSEEYVKFGTQNNQSFTIEFWVKVTQGGGKDQNVFLSTYIGGSGWHNGWMMYWRNSSGGIYRATWGETGGNICEPSLSAPEDGEWQHFLFVYSDTGLPDSPDLRAKLYVNGEVKTTEKNVGSRYYNSSNFADNNKPMTAFGRYMRTGDDNLFEEGFAGYMKNIRIWKSAKNDTYIQESYKGTAEVTGKEGDLVAAWNFTTKPSGTTSEVLDLTGRHTAKIVGTYKWERVAEGQ